MANDARDDTKVAIEVFAKGTEVLKGDVKKYRHVEFGLFSKEESDQFTNFSGLVSQYLARSLPPRPLSLAVFGAPGSGKSRLVKKLPDLLGKAGAALGSLTEINLTQVTSVDSLSFALNQAREAAGDKVPFVFFDEFDTSLAGAPWGWIYWFLAPMQDGAFRHLGARIELKRAVYVFAGGTASTFADFGQTDRGAFASAKGPDFVSRLRGYLDIAGINSDLDRPIRRAAALRHQLQNNQKKIDRVLLQSLLEVGRYKHGTRSMEAIVELMPNKSTPVLLDDIRNLPLLGMHIDRGPLDPRLIGGYIGLSCSDVEAHKFERALQATCEALFRDGATIASAGRQSQGLEHQLALVSRRLTERLEPGDDIRIMLLGKGKRSRKKTGTHIGTIEDPRESGQEPWTDAVNLFRMRHAFASRSVAQFAVGGSLTGPSSSTKRYPGVAEELMLALAMRHPVYIAGGLGGAAQWAGVLLGLGRSWTGLVPGFDEEWQKIPDQIRALFQPPPYGNLPITRQDLIAFFKRHAIGGPRWVGNGLSLEENRQLFETDDTGLIATLVRRGLRNHFARTTVGR